VCKGFDTVKQGRHVNTAGRGEMHEKKEKCIGKIREEEKEIRR